MLIFIVFVAIIAPSEPLELTLLHTNDIHARLEMITIMGAECPSDGSEECYGGLSRRSSFIKAERAKGEIILLDAGDQFQGTTWFHVYKGLEASHFMNYLKYTAMALGNHEFDNGVEGLRGFLGNVTFPILCSNLDRRRTMPNFLRVIESYINVIYKRQNIVIIGYITDLVPTLSRPWGLSFRNEIRQLKEIVAAQVRRGEKYIIAVGHAGYRGDVKMAQEIPDLDIVVSAHSHTLLHTPTPETARIIKERITDKYPFVVTHRDGRKTLVVQTGCWGKFIGQLKVEFNEAGHISNYSGNTILLDKKIPNDPVVDEQVTALKTVMTQFYLKKVGTSDIFLDATKGKCRYEECNIGNVAMDAVVSYFIDDWPDLAIGILNAGGIRKSIGKGTVTYNDVITTFPFGNTFVITKVNGYIIKEILEHSILNFVARKGDGKFLQVSGIKVRYDLTKPSYSRVANIRVKRMFLSDIYRPLDMEKQYFLATPKYLFQGGDGYASFQNHNCQGHDVDAVDQDILIQYFQNESPIKTGLERRIVFSSVPEPGEDDTLDDVTEPYIYPEPNPLPPVPGPAPGPGPAPAPGPGPGPGPAPGPGPGPHPNPGPVPVPRPRTRPRPRPRPNKGHRTSTKMMIITIHFMIFTVFYLPLMP